MSDLLLNEPDCSKKFAMAIALASAVSVANLQNSVWSNGRTAQLRVMAQLLSEAGNVIH